MLTIKNIILLENINYNGRFNMNKKIPTKLNLISFIMTLLFIMIMLNGSAIADWQSMDSGTTESLYGIWGSSGSNVFAVGDSGTILYYEIPSIVTTTTTVSSTTTTTGSSTTTTTPITTTTTTSPQPCPVEEVELLRYFRDNVLNKTTEGQELIRLYYELIPAIAKAMEEDEEFKEELKKIIDGTLPLIEEETY
jgi:hypothetical protein